MSEHQKNINASKKPTEIDKARSREREYKLVDQEERRQYGYALEVQADGSHDVFVWGKSIVDQVRVVDDVPAEQDCSPDCVQQVDCVRKRDEDSDNSGHTYGDATICE